MNDHRPTTTQLLLCMLAIFAAGLHQAEAQRAQYSFQPPAAGYTNNARSSMKGPFFTREAARFQQVYEASGFYPLNFYGGAWIRTIDFRVEETKLFSFFVTSSNLQLTLSTTSRNPDELSSTFSENIGSDSQVVVGPGSWAVSGTGGGGLGIFSQWFTFTNHPFFYDPAKGNLLIDLQLPSGVRGWPTTIHPDLDAIELAGDEVSSVLGIGPTLPTTGTPSTLGLVTVFSVIPVPGLTVNLESTNLIISWPMSLNDFRLEQSAVMGVGASWLPAGGIVTTNYSPTGNEADLIQVTLPQERSSPGRFFRLVSQ